MRRQVKAYLTAHGTDPSKIDESTFGDICIMYADGLIGNQGILETLGNLTAGQFNKMLPKNHKAYRLKDIIGKAYDYIYPPVDETTQKQMVSQNLLAFAMMSPNAPDLFKGK